MPRPWDIRRLPFVRSTTKSVRVAAPPATLRPNAPTRCTTTRSAVITTSVSSRPSPSWAPAGAMSSTTVSVRSIEPPDWRTPRPATSRRTPWSSSMRAPSPRIAAPSQPRQTACVESSAPSTSAPRPSYSARSTIHVDAASIERGASAAKTSAPVAWDEDRPTTPPAITRPAIASSASTAARSEVSATRSNTASALVSARVSVTIVFRSVSAPVASTPSTVTRSNVTSALVRTDVSVVVAAQAPRTVTSRSIVKPGGAECAAAESTIVWPSATRSSASAIVPNGAPAVPSPVAPGWT